MKEEEIRKTDIYLFSGYDLDMLKFKAKPVEKLIKGILNKDKMEEEFEKILK